MPSHLHRVLFPVENLIQAVEISKRILTQEKLDRQLAGESAGAPLSLPMKVETGQWHKTVMFNEGNIIGAKIDNLTSMLGKLCTQNRHSKPLKPRVY